MLVRTAPAQLLALRSLDSITRRAFTSRPTSAGFWTSDERLIAALRRRHEAYRLRQVGSSARKKADRTDAVQLAKAEVRWMVQHVRALQTDRLTAKTLDRQSRRTLVGMAMQMTRSHTPLSYLLGTVPFGALPVELTVRPPVLLPRPETEHWASQVVADLLRSLETRAATAKAPVRVVDLCTGSGCIALLIAEALRAKLGEHGDWRVVGCDRSPLAVELARENAAKLGWDDGQGSNVRFVEADVFSDDDMDRLASAAGGAFELVVSNPPYIPRREWEALSAEVKAHEDPAALIGERNIPPASPSAHAHATESKSANADMDDARTRYLDRAGLAFHQRLAELLYRPSFASPHPQLKMPEHPRLVAEYGKGQHSAVAKLHNELRAPARRMPRIVRVQGTRLVVVGVGNATTHPLTRHSIGQVVLDPLLAHLAALDAHTRKRLVELREALEHQRTQAICSGRIDVDLRPDWTHAVPNHLPVSSSSSGLDSAQAQRGATDSLGLGAPAEVPVRLAKVTEGKSGGWAAVFPLLVPASEAFLSPYGKAAWTGADEEVVYEIDVALYKPSQAMNLSGVGLRAFLSAHHPCATAEGAVEDVLVLQDELDLEFGQVKRKDTGSARGHNGIRDILARLNMAPSPKAKSNNNEGPKLARLRIGIGRPTPPPQSKGSEWLPASLTKTAKPVPVDRWVLSRLSSDELQSSTKPTGEVAGQVAEATVEWIRERCLAIASSGAVGTQQVRLRKDQFDVYRTVWIYGP